VAARVLDVCESLDSFFSLHIECAGRDLMV
jgi:hypothetical protein